MPQQPKIFGKTLRLSWTEIIMGLAAVIIGLVLTIWPGVASSVVICGVGAVGIVIGIVHAVRYFMMDKRQSVASYDMGLGLTWIIGGILVIVLKKFLLSLLPIFFGLAILLGGIAKFQFTLNMKRMGVRRWYIELAGAIVSIVLGTLILTNPFSTALLLMRIIGISLLIEGIQDLASCYAFKKARDAFFVETTLRDN